jgi:adenine/guanine phosphoribosyltransferase-like PRPP-binding protein
MYLKQIMREPQHTISEVMKQIAPHHDKFDAIVCTGLSGLLIGPLLANKLGKRLGVVRKDIERQNGVSHADVLIETNMEATDRWLFVDDLIASGKTIRRVENRMIGEGYGRMTGYIMYNYPRITWESWKGEEYV